MCAQQWPFLRLLLQCVFLCQLSYTVCMCWDEAMKCCCAAIVEVIRQRNVSTGLVFLCAASLSLQTINRLSWHSRDERVNLSVYKHGCTFLMLLNPTRVCTDSGIVIRHFRYFLTVGNQAVLLSVNGGRRYVSSWHVQRKRL